MNLPKSGNLVLRHDYWKGSFFDYSGNGNSGVPSGVNFEKRPDKHVRFRGTDLITVADAAELQLTTGTLIVYGDFDSYSSSDRLIFKRDGGGTNYDFYFSAANEYTFYDGVNARTATVTYAGAKSVAVSFVSGSKAKAYKDGVYVTEFSDTSTVTADDANLLIGNSLGGGDPQTNPFKGVLIYNTVLTAAEIAQVHEWIMENTKTPKFPKRSFLYPAFTTGRERGCIGAWRMKKIHNQIVDLSGNGNHGTPSNVSSFGGRRLKGLVFRESSKGIITVPHTTDLEPATAITVRAFVKSTTANTVNGILGKTNNSWNVGYALDTYAGGSKRYRFWCNDYSSYVSQMATDYIVGEWYHLVGTYDKQNVTLYVNGIAQTPVALTADIAASAQAFLIGQLPGATYYSDADIADGVLVLDRCWSAEEVAADYRKFARLPRYIDDLSDVNVSIAAEGGIAGSYLSDTKFQFGDATARYKISDKTGGVYGEKQIECTTEGVLYQPDRQAYGTWEFECYKGQNTNAISIFVIADTIGAEDAAGQDGYGLRFDANNRVVMRESTNGVASNLFYTDVNYCDTATWYTFKVTRRYDGVFTVYVKGGAFSDWTLVDPSGGAGTNPTAADQSTTTSKYIVIDNDAGDKVTGFKFYEGVC